MNFQDRRMRSKAHVTIATETLHLTCHRHLPIATAHSLFSNLSIMSERSPKNQQ